MLCGVLARTHTHTHTLAWHLIAMQECSKSSGCVGDSLQSTATHDSHHEVQKLGVFPLPSPACRPHGFGAAFQTCTSCTSCIRKRLKESNSALQSLCAPSTFMNGALTSMGTARVQALLAESRAVDLPRAQEGPCRQKALAVPQYLAWPPCVKLQSSPEQHAVEGQLSPLLAPSLAMARDELVVAEHCMWQPSSASPAEKELRRPKGKRKEVE